MTQEEHNFLAGIYRNQERISELLTMIGSLLERATGVRPIGDPAPKPEQATLDREMDDCVRIGGKYYHAECAPQEGEDNE